MSHTMNSRCFTCTLMDKDPDLGEYLTRITLRRVHFAHTPLILTASEIDELRGLLVRWPAHGLPAEAGQEADDAAAND